MSNRRIRQRFTSAFAHGSLKLTFRQVYTAEQTGEVEFQDVNHCTTTEDCFGFVIEDFLNPLR